MTTWRRCSPASTVSSRSFPPTCLPRGADPSGGSLYRARGAQRGRLRADVSGTARKVPGLEGLLPRSSSWRFEVRLVPEGDRWKVAWASYQPAEGR